MTPVRTPQEAEPLVRANVGLVYYCLRRVRPGVAGEDDLEGEGMLALHRAALTWRPECGRFSTYACACIKGAMWRAANGGGAAGGAAACEPVDARPLRGESRAVGGPSPADEAADRDEAAILPALL